MYQYILVYLYLFLGILCILTNKPLYQNYIILLLFFLLKAIFNYRKCTISYFEVKMRKVKKKEGYLYTLLNDIVDIRYSRQISIIYLLCSIILYYYFEILDKAILIN